jgi:outer membrane receptor protein involved in Fe transport
MRALGLRSLPEVLKLVPGFETSRDVQGFLAGGGARHPRRVGAAGALRRHRLNNAYDSKALPTSPPRTVERVEVMRGPGSALFGTGAFLGTVNVVSKRRDTIEAAVSGGLYGTVDGHVSAGLKTDSGFQLYGDGSFLRTDGYRREIKEDGSSAAMVKAGRPEDEPAGFTNDSNLFANVGAEGALRPPAAPRPSWRCAGCTRTAARWWAVRTLGRDSKLMWDVILADLTEEVPFSAGTVSRARLLRPPDRRPPLPDRPDGLPPGHGEGEGRPVRAHPVPPRRPWAWTPRWTSPSPRRTSSPRRVGQLGAAAGVGTRSTSRAPRSSPTCACPPATSAAEQEAFKLAPVGGVFLQYVLRPVEWFSLTAGLRLDKTHCPAWTRRATTAAGRAWSAA